MSEQATEFHVDTEVSRFTKAGALLVAWLACYTIASVAQSQFVLQNLTELGVVINGNQWLEHTILDWWGLLPKFGGAIFLSLTLSVFISGRLGRWLKLRRNWLHAVGGALAMLLMLAIMHPLLNVTLIAGTRSFAGMCWQALAGAVGGELYRILRQDLARWIIQRPKQNALL
ncbi:hypothetical protein SAMN05216361_1594 [Marisediminitalea aggregata]|uniref:Uncharacterized protein n=1 Tax=Marisediminitalea aggregata TaxID=634436 RepID=A0A1M5HRZ0_9ALTE|nr:hypothetical protein [Marisediminitalea aggregata]SHG18739.1 hypothetical protein SAMN05216361_1594 [Marisediminitalea aggregata]